MKKLIFVLALMVVSQVHADYDYGYGYGYQSDAASHEQAERNKRNNNINNDYNSATSNTSNYHRSEGYGLTSVN